MAPHRYWRIKSTAANGSQNISAVSHLGFAKVGEPQYAAVTAIASSDDGGQLPANAFDGNILSRWEAGVVGIGSWIGMDFGAGNEKEVTTVRMRQHSNERSMTDFDVEHSDDGVIWNVAWSSPTGIGIWTNLPVRSFPDPSAPKSLVRILDTQAGSAGSAVGEMELRHASGGADQLLNSVFWPIWGGLYQFGPTAEKLIDNDASTAPFILANQYLVTEPPGGYAVCEELALTRNSGSDTRMMQAFKVQTSSDGGATWDDEVEFTGLAAWASGETRVFTLPQTRAKTAEASVVLSSMERGTVVGAGGRVVRLRMLQQRR